MAIKHFYFSLVDSHGPVLRLPFDLCEKFGRRLWTQMLHVPRINVSTCYCGRLHVFLYICYSQTIVWYADDLINISECRSQSKMYCWLLIRTWKKNIDIINAFFFDGWRKSFLDRSLIYLRFRYPASSLMSVTVWFPSGHLVLTWDTNFEWRKWTRIGIRRIFILQKCRRNLLSSARFVYMTMIYYRKQVLTNFTIQFLSRFTTANYH